MNAEASSYCNTLRDTRPGRGVRSDSSASAHPARVLLERFRTEYNTEHLHSSLGYQTPNEYAAAHPVGAA